MTESTNLTLEDVNKFKDPISADFSQYSVSLLGLADRNLPNEGQPVGSGTLIKVDDRYAILTADHVIGELLGTEGERTVTYEWAGILLSYPGGAYSHPIILSLEDVQRGAITIARHPSMAQCMPPDLGTIVLTADVVQQLEERQKIFYDLDVVRQKVETANPQAADGLWFLCGLPGESASWPWNEKLQTVAPEAESACFVGGVESIFLADPFDYYHTPVNYAASNENNQLPASFRGISGGGVWFVPVYWVPSEGTFHVQEMITHSFLAGVVFCQVKVDGIVVSIRSHGWRSIYGVSIDAIRART